MQGTPLLDWSLSAMLEKTGIQTTTRKFLVTGMIACNTVDLLYSSVYSIR